MESQFTHLHLHTEYSIRDGIVRLDALIDAVANDGMQAVAVTDFCNLFGLVKFYRKAINKGIKPIVGADVCVLPANPDHQSYQLTLLCQNQQGYENLITLISKAYLLGQKQGDIFIEEDWLTDCSNGIIIISGGCKGDVGQQILAGNLPEASKRAKRWQDLVGDRYYLELIRTDRAGEETCVQGHLAIAAELDIPVIASNDVRFLTEDDFNAHEARVCINQGYTLQDSRRPLNYSSYQYLRTQSEMVELFADVPEALANSVELAKRCNVSLTLGENFLPNFPVPEGVTVDEYLKQEAEQGLLKRLSHIDTDDPRQYEDRLSFELSVIKSMGFPGYFLIVADFIHWAKANGVPVGPGRGSGAGSLVAYSLGITDVDPLPYGLLFERFLNPERVSMPDFDIDFCMEGRDRVIEYVAERYGREAVSQIITYGTMAAKAVVRDVGRVQGYPYGFVDQIAKLIPFELGMTLKKALQQEELLLQQYQDDEEVKDLIDMALKLEGVARNAGKHAGGVVIAPSKLTDFTPLYCEEGGANLVTQFDKDDVEAVGLVKFDFLGLRTLTIIKWALENIKKSRDIDLDIDSICMNDKDTFDLLKACQSTAVFQLESRGMKDLIKRLQPDCFDEIVALVALFRPGPLQSGMVDDFIDRKHGRAPVVYPHPELEPILKPTYGVILYQEQVMQIAQVLANYKLGHADLLRKAMGKKKPEEMAKQRTMFLEGATKRGIDGKLANYIFDLMEKFAGYGFNKSHSVAYALISYQTAYLKAHFPAEFMAAVLSSDMDNTDKVVMLLEDCQGMGLKVLPPNLKLSAYEFTVNAHGEIVYGLGAIKGVGESAIENIIDNQSQGVEYSCLFSLCRILDTRKVNRRVLEALIKSGAMDHFNQQRSVLMASVDIAIKAAEQYALSQERGQNDLFGSFAQPQDQANVVEYIEAKPWDDLVRLQNEKETLGHYITGHPIGCYESELSHFISSPIGKLHLSMKNPVKIAGFVSAIRTMNAKNGSRIGFVSLEDKTGRMEVALFRDVFTDHRELLQKDTMLIVEGEISQDKFTDGIRMTAKKVMPLSSARETYARHIIIQLSAQQVTADFSQHLQKTLSSSKGECPVFIDYYQQDAKARLALGSEWSVLPSDELISQLSGLPYCERVRVEY